MVPLDDVRDTITILGDLGGGREREVVSLLNRAMSILLHVQCTCIHVYVLAIATCTCTLYYILCTMY